MQILRSSNDDILGINFMCVHAVGENKPIGSADGLFPRAEIANQDAGDCLVPRQNKVESLLNPVCIDIGLQLSIPSKLQHVDKRYGSFGAW